MAGTARRRDGSGVAAGHATARARPIEPDRHAPVLNLQGAAGNRAVGRLLTRPDGTRPDGLVVARVATLGGVGLASTMAGIEQTVRDVAAMKNPDETHGLSPSVVAGLVEGRLRADEELLTNIVFWALHPEARYRMPGPDESELQSHRQVLGREVVRPALPIVAERLGRYRRSDDATAFRQEVYRRQRAKKLEEGAVFEWGVADSELGTTKAGKRLHVDVVADFDDMWSEAKKDLRSGTVMPDRARRTKRIGVGSGYRSSASDFDNWITAFTTNYDATKEERGKLPGGSHGKRAIALMVRRMVDRKAVPGFSNHTSGRAIDVTTTYGEPKHVVDGKEEGGVYDFGASGSQSAGWPNTWLHAWLTDHAQRFNFRPYRKEPWHWDHVTASADG